MGVFIVWSNTMNYFSAIILASCVCATAQQVVPLCPPGSISITPASDGLCYQAPPRSPYDHGVAGRDTRPLVTPEQIKQDENLGAEAEDAAKQLAPNVGKEPLLPMESLPQPLVLAPVPALQPPVSDNSEYARYIQERNRQNYEAGQQIGNAVGASLAHRLAVRKIQAMQQSILQSQEQVQKLTEELAAKKEADRQKAWAQISQRGDNYEPSNSIVKKCIDGSIGFHVELSCEQAYGTQEGFVKACNGIAGMEWYDGGPKGACGSRRHEQTLVQCTIGNGHGYDVVPCP